MTAHSKMLASGAARHASTTALVAAMQFRNLTGYFVYILLVATIGPLLFGFHLVRRCARPTAPAAAT